MLRLFAAIPIDDDAAAGLTRLQTGLEPVRWSPPENFHVTLRFFGEASEIIADDIDLALAQISAQPFDLSLEGAGAFGEASEPRAIWAGVADSPALTALAKACERAARRAGLKPETRAFSPHVTLAYLRGQDSAAVARWIQASNLYRAAAPVRVSRFGLYSSHASKHGGRYQLERVYRL